MGPVDNRQARLSTDSRLQPTWQVTPCSRMLSSFHDPHILRRVLLALVPAAMAQSGSESIAGRWDATIQINGVDTPFPLEITGSGANVTGSFFNGDDRYASTKGKFENGKLELHLGLLRGDSYARRSRTVCSKASMRARGA